MTSRFRTIIDKICGLDDRFEMLNERLTLIEETVGINTFMSIGEGNVGNVGSGNVGVGSTVPPDVARYQKLVAAKTAGHESSGNIGSTDNPGNVGHESSGNIGSTDNPGPEESQRERIERRAQERESGRTSECGVDPAPSVVTNPPKWEDDGGNVGSGNVGNVGTGDVCH